MFILFGVSLRRLPYFPDASMILSPSVRPSAGTNPVGQYRVIWSDGDFISCGSLESDYLAAVKPATFRNNALSKYKSPGTKQFGCMFRKLLLKSFAPAGSIFPKASDSGG